MVAERQKTQARYGRISGLPVGLEFDALPGTETLSPRPPLLNVGKSKGFAYRQTPRN
jgi:hypothetical protein